MTSHESAKHQDQRLRHLKREDERAMHRFANQHQTREQAESNNNRMQQGDDDDFTAAVALSSLSIKEKKLYKHK